MQIDKSWTLFLDRDGVINKKKDNDYVKNWEEFLFIDRSVDAISFLSKLFGKIIIVTNQRGVGKGVMTEFDLILIHQKMVRFIEKKSGRIDKIYYCTCVSDNAECRKPNIGNALKSKSDFPDIDFKKSVIAGDSLSDMIFGKKTGMTRILISSNPKLLENSKNFDKIFKSLFDYSNFLSNFNEI